MNFLDEKKDVTVYSSMTDEELMKHFLSYSRPIKDILRGINMKEISLLPFLSTAKDVYFKIVNNKENYIKTFKGFYEVFNEIEKRYGNKY